jgi:hypothetical protein
VWFDQSELRGGDAWDAAIRNQVSDCTLFMALISANTNARTEGCFRREWNLAVQRMLDMADDRPFLLPVLIDDTPEPAARVSRLVVVDEIDTAQLLAAAGPLVRKCGSGGLLPIRAIPLTRRYCLESLNPRRR